MTRFFADFLFVLAAWTLVIKYIFPVAYALNVGQPALTYVMWDFWWVAHIWLGWALIRQPRYTFPLALTVSVVEIVIVVTKFVMFLSGPQWDIWHTNWFINKVFVLACFVLLFAYLLAGWKSGRREGVNG
ncbi:MAG TPA: hypothetical protein VF460_00075 [Burkholderiales bacterium]